MTEKENEDKKKNVRKNITVTEKEADIIEKEGLDFSKWVRNMFKKEFPEYYLELEDPYHS